MKKVLYIHIILVILELIAQTHDILHFGWQVICYYTIDSNLLQLIVSVLIIYQLLVKKVKVLPVSIGILHLTSAVALTITFMISFFVLAPQGGYDYYFLQGAAPVDHLTAPLLSVITFFMEDIQPLPKKAVIVPMCATLAYGIFALFMNYIRFIEGPYFFLEIYNTPVQTIALWFGIISVLCLIIPAIYMAIKKKLQQVKKKS